MAAKRGAEYSCTNGNTVGSQCQVSCPLKNQQPYCKSANGPATFTCDGNGKWNMNKKNDCECKTACQAPEEQFSHISEEVLPTFDTCRTSFKNAKCNAKCP